MHGNGADWPGVFRYDAPKHDTDGEGYWIFAPIIGGEIELFQLSFVSLGERLRELRFTVTTADGVHDFKLHPEPGNKVVTSQQVIWSSERFRIAAAPYFDFSSASPDHSYRIKTLDPGTGMAADLVVRPAARHHWQIVGSNYLTTLNSILEGTITIGGKSHTVSTVCAFEHSTWIVPANSPPDGAMPPFWHYEYVHWNDGKRQFGSFLWHILNSAGVRSPPSGVITAYPGDSVAEFNSYEIAYKDIADHQGLQLPRSWEVIAKKGEESLTYRAEVHRIIASTNRKGYGFSDFLLDCQGRYSGPGGDVVLNGRGRTEYIAKSHNPVAQ